MVFFSLSNQQIFFDVIAISKIRINKNKKSVFDISLPNYSYEFCPTESSAGGTLLYKSNNLHIYKSNELESTFIKISNAKKTNIVIGYIYMHSGVNFSEFNEFYVNDLLKKLSKDNKTIFLLRDF